MKAISSFLLALSLAAILAMPLGGFLFGFVHCSDCGWNPLARVFIGLVFAVLTPLSAGYPPRNEGGVGEAHNAWPYIWTAAILVFAIVILVLHQRSRLRKAH